MNVGGDPTCGGLVQETNVVLYESAEACCVSEYNWIDVELCATRSAQTVNGKYWPDVINGKCLEDAKVPATDLSVNLFDTIAECCEMGLFWLSEKTCLTASGFNVTVATSSKKFFVDWTMQRCVQDCEGSAPCGGLAQTWDILYNTENDCCDIISWIPKETCLHN